jgi:uncharacterized protein YecE (DUF72 family)
MSDRAHPPGEPGRIYVGTSGWSYPQGRGAWTGIFYPAGPEPAGRRVDALAYYAERFETVEVNSSFYRPPSPAVARSWAARTPSRFLFSVKLYQRFTHPAMADRPEGEVAWSAQPAEVDVFRRALEPIARAGKLGALLAQFPPSFAASAATRDYLRWLLATFKDYPLAVELRHRSWSDERAVTLEILGEFGAAWVQIDEPKFRFSIRQDFRPNVPGLYYMRLHGRNAATWWRHEAAEERYDYLYTPDELRPFADAAREAARHVRRVLVYLNNHFAAKAVANAVMLKHQLGQRVSAGFPPAFLARYPEVAPLVATSPRLL